MTRADVAFEDRKLALLRLDGLLQLEEELASWFARRSPEEAA